MRTEALVAVKDLSNRDIRILIDARACEGHHFSLRCLLLHGICSLRVVVSLCDLFSKTPTKIYRGI